MLKNLTTLSTSEKADFLNSFDYILCDVDGVLWNGKRRIVPGAPDTISKLKSLNKRIFYITNNNLKSQEVYSSQLQAAGYDLNIQDLVRPAQPLIHHLKKIKFSKKIYLIGMPALREELQREGFRIESFHLNNPRSSVPVYVENALTWNPEVGAVVIDFDVNMQVVQLQKAATYLRYESVLFFTLGPDRKLLFGDDVVVIGPGVYQEIVQDITGRVPVCFGKPSADYNSFIKEKFEIEDPSRVLVIGDSVPQDMVFATNCGYKKLLVLSGVTPESAVENWTFGEECKPEFYVKNLGEMKDFLEM